MGTVVIPPTPGLALRDQCTDTVGLELRKCDGAIHPPLPPVARYFVAITPVRNDILLS